MTREEKWTDTFKTLPQNAGEFVLRRLVTRAILDSRSPPDFLFTSGRPGRFNPRDTFSLYLSEDAATAGAEFERYWAGKPVQHVLYFCSANIPFLDLGAKSIRDALGLDESELFLPWRMALHETATQTLGRLVAAQKRFAAIRFPSDAAKARGFAGFNFALFRDAVELPWSVVITDDAGIELQRWP